MVDPMSSCITKGRHHTTTRCSSPNMNCTEVTPACSVEATFYRYRHNAACNGFFAATFTILFIVQVVSVCCLRVRTWTYMISLAIGTGFEVVGYIARPKIRNNPWSSAATSAQLVTLVVGPPSLRPQYLSPLIYCGAEYSILRPRLLPFIMVGTDFLRILAQFVGASILAKASNEDNQSPMHAARGKIVDSFDRTVELSSTFAKDSKPPECTSLVTWARNLVGLPPFVTG